MDTKRIIIFAAIVFVAMQLWSAWQEDYKHASKALTKTEVTTTSSSIPQDVISNAANHVNDNTNATKIPATLVDSEQAPTGSDIVSIKTDVLELKIDSATADIVEAALPKYTMSINQPEKPMILFNSDPEYRYFAESTFIGKGSPYNKNTSYQSSSRYYVLTDNQQQIIVDFSWKNPQDVEFIKRYKLTRSKYDIDIEYIINNQSDNIWRGNLVTQLSRTDKDPNAGKGFFTIHAYFGASISTQADPYQKLTFSDIKKKKVMEQSQGGWAAMQQHYFLSAWIPRQDQENLYYTHMQDNHLYTVGIRGAELKAAPGETVSTDAKLYVGPELTEQLKDIAPHLDMTVDYGWLWFISDILYWLLAKMYWLIGNWGWAIIAVTILVKLLFYPLSAASYRSMSKMRALQPKIATLRERYAEDRQKLTQETMALYKREKINPFGGCLPILIQIPIFIALYWVLVESVQLRQAPFIFWIHDLSVKDPFFILPILMGISMIIQQRMNPAPPDPTQAKIMMFLPVVFTLLFMNFPAGLVLYWVVNNGISILQQWYIMRNYNHSNRAPIKTNSKKIKSKSSK